MPVGLACLLLVLDLAALALLPQKLRQKKEHTDRRDLRMQRHRNRAGRISAAHRNFPRRGVPSLNT